MRSVAFTALGGALLAGLATPALAQTAVPFSGPRVEGIIGWDRTQVDGGHDDGALYGAGVGYDVRRGNNVFGIDGEISDSTAKECSGAGLVADPEVCAKAGRDLYIGGRVGTVVNNGTTLLYAKAGYTNARYKLTYDNGNSSEVIDDTNLDGIRVGAGAEYAIGPNSFVKAEYRYSNYQDGISRHQALGGFGFRF